VIVGNPPFLGDKKMRGELGDAYVETLRKLYAERVPGGADFVTYWFERSRELMVEAIGAAARRLVELRENWLSPAGVEAGDLKQRTLTSLYNQRPA
jgi:methylase of polypeptide subunit release factors